MANNNNRRSSLTIGERLLFLAGSMFCLILITTALMGSLFAKYTTSDTGSDSARVAKFGDISIVETGDFVSGTNKLLITPGVDIRKEAKVVFEGSETATYVFVEVILSDNWKMTEDGKFTISNQLTWEMAEGWSKIGDFVFYKELAPNVELSADIIKGGTIKVGAEITKNTLNKFASTISFRASVVQSHGFASVNDAWDSLRAKGGGLP